MIFTPRLVAGQLMNNHVLPYPLSLDCLFQQSDHSCVQKLTMLNLPEKAVFLDVDGTIVGQQHLDSIDEGTLQKFGQLCSSLRSLNWAIGLNSDTPLCYLDRVAQRMGLVNDTPIIAEHGAVFSFAGLEIHLHSMTDAAEWKTAIREIARSSGFHEEIPDGVFSLVYGGTQPKDLIASSKWGFGANRHHSVSVFAPSVLIEDITKRLDHTVLNSRNLYVHSNPKECFLAIHKQSVPGMSAEANKAKALALIERAILAQGRSPNIVMIGDGPADFVDNALFGTSIWSIMVPGGRGVPEDVGKRVHFTPQKRLLEGVIEGMEFILRGASR